MKDYLKMHVSQAAYETWLGSTNFITPNVSAITGSSSVLYHPIHNLHDYSQDYFTIIAKESGTITFTYTGGDPSSSFTSMSYSINDGEWITTNYDSVNGNTINVSVSNNDKVRWKGINNAMYYGNNNDINFFSNFTSSCFVDIEGNIMSLLYGDNFIGQTNLTGKPTAFAGIFINQYNQSVLKIISAENLILSATTLSYGCYYGMFLSCTSLTTAPELPATTLASYCYDNMFQGCTSLITAPELPATTLNEYCYQSMFYNCTSLIAAPELPATTLAQGCYSLMFLSCTSLITAPELPATTLADYCYNGMFNVCTSLTTAPELPATTLANNCYREMFYNCTSLNYIKCLATDISASSCTTNWVQNVAASGTFVKADNMSSWTTGNNGIPSGWTVQDAA